MSAATIRLRVGWDPVAAGRQTGLFVEALVRQARLVDELHARHPWSKAARRDVLLMLDEQSFARGGS